MVVPRRVTEGWAVETGDGLIFTVKGAVHPPDRVIAYLRYAPDPTGDRRARRGPREGTTYRRVYLPAEQAQVLASRHPEYVVHEPMMDMTVQAVPWSDIERVYDPCAQLRCLRADQPATEGELAALRLATLIADGAGVNLGDIGLSGSFLVGLDEMSSDIDLVVYGWAAGKAIRRALAESARKQGSEIRPLDAKELRALHRATATETPVPFSAFRRTQGRKVNEGAYEGRRYFLRFVRRPHEVGEVYGDPRYERGPCAVVSAVVENADEALFTPNRYLLGAVRFLRGESYPDLREIVSFRGRFAEQAEAGERVEARGRIERVVRGRGNGWRRLVVGAPGDYMVPVSG